MGDGDGASGAVVDSVTLAVVGAGGEAPDRMNGVVLAPGDDVT